MGGFISFFKTTKGLLTLGFLIIALIAIPVTVYLVGQQQNLQQSAHVPQPSVTTACQSANVFITYSYIITNVPAGATVNVTVTDTQNYVSDSFSWKNGDPTYTRSVNTNKASILAGVLTFQTSVTDGFQKTNQVGYQATGPCAAPTATPTLTPTLRPTASPTLTLTPTLRPTVTLTPTLTPTITLTPTLTPTITLTPTLTPTTALTATPTNAGGPGDGLSDGLSDGRSTSPTPTVAQPTLAPTGPSTTLINIGIFGILIALIGGILLLGL